MLTGKGPKHTTAQSTAITLGEILRPLQQSSAGASPRSILAIQHVAWNYQRSHRAGLVLDRPKQAVMTFACRGPRGSCLPMSSCDGGKAQQHLR